MRNKRGTAVPAPANRPETRRDLGLHLGRTPNPPSGQDMDLFNEHQVVAVPIDHLLAEITQADYGITGDQFPFEDQTSHGTPSVTGEIVRDKGLGFR
jgi:hypothetical protein